MSRTTCATVLLAGTLILPASTTGQTGSTTGQTAPPKPVTPAPPTPGAATKKTTTQAKPQPPMTLRQVIESLISLRSSNRVADLISRRSVTFKLDPGVTEILKEFGADQKLLSLIPSPPPVVTPKLPAPKVAGSLTVVCEPTDCAVVVNDLYKGPTTERKKSVTGLPAGAATILVFADGYENVTRRIELAEEKPHEEKFSLKKTTLLRQQGASAAMLKTLAELGGIDGMVEFGDIEGTGTLHWTDSSGQVQEWPMTFRKRLGKELTTTFKTKDGQCSASISGANSRHECRGGLRGSGEKITEQAVSLFLSYQVLDVAQTLLKRPLVASEADDSHLTSSNGVDEYELTIGENDLPSELVYRIGSSTAPIRVQYSNYLKMPKSRYPGRTAIGRLNSDPVWVFTFTSVRSNVGRN